MKLIAFLILVSFSALANAYDLVSEVRFLDPNPVLPGTVNRVEVTVTNFGQTTAIDAAGGAVFRVGAGQSTLYVANIQETPPCVVRYDSIFPPPGEPIYYAAAIKPDSSGDIDLSPGESFSCTVGIITYPDSPPVIRQRFTTLPFVDDENPNNNDSLLNVITGNGSIAVPSLNLWGLALLVLMTSFVASRSIVGRAS